jgi:hypothetical protein
MVARDSAGDRREVESVYQSMTHQDRNGPDMSAFLTLAQRYELVREELAETIALNEKLGAPLARAWRNCSLRSMLRRPVPRARGIIALAEHRAWRQPRPKLCAQPRGCLRDAPQAE